MWFGNVQALPPLTRTFKHGETLELGTADKTYTAVAIGTANGNRMVVACVKGDNSGGQPTAVTIGGVAATSIAAISSGSQYNSIWAAKVPTGTTGNIRVQWSGAPDRQGISVYEVQNKRGAVTASATATDAVTAYTQSITIPARGIAIGCGISGNAAGTGTWTNLTEDYDANGSNGTLVTASTASAAGASPSVTFTPSGSDNPSMALAAWGP